ncbi:MAG: hypothetical protein ACOYIE_05425 [Agathobaculum sp.]|jgi:hypothetical protein|uniref:hypothetical protein n=1 Tax=Agathobaculum sp. TaxID=2048138 RepID=UPI003D915105
MKTSDLIKALNRLKVQTGSLVCIGCGYEQNCSTQGCRLIREAADKLCGMEWIDPAVELPPDDNGVLVIASGKPKKNVTLDRAICTASLIRTPRTASHDETCDWVIDEWPEWETPQVLRWMPLPEEETI